MNDWFKDLRYAVRSLLRSPAFAITTIGTLALGIGANTAIFSVVRGVLLKPLPHRDGDQLFYLRQSSDALGASSLTFSVPEIRDLRAGVPSLGAGIAEYSPFSSILYVGEDASRVSVGLVTGNYFEVMGLRPIHGRVTRPSDDGTGVPPVIVLTHDFWMRRFGGDSGIVDQPVRIAGTSATVIGVLQPAPFFPLRMDVMMNKVISAHHTSPQMTEVRDHRMTEVVARLVPGATQLQAQTEVATVFRRLHSEYPQAYDAAAHPRVEVVPFRQALGEQAQVTLWLLMGAAAFVMIIAAANVANLTLMRCVRREQELVVRASLGAGVARLRRLLLAENLTIALAGGGLGVAIAVTGLPLLVSLANRYSPRANEIGLDVMVLGFTVALAVGVALLFSLVAPLASEGSLATVVAGGGRATGGARKQRLQRGLVVVQVAVSVVLLAGAGLLTRTLLRLSDVPTGLRTEEILTMQANLLAAVGPRADSNAIGAARQRFALIRDEIAALPGVVKVGLGSTPLRTQGQGDIDVEGKPLGPGEAVRRTDMRGASPDYFQAAGIPLISGRPFLATDRGPAGKVVIINQTLAKQLFPGEDPVGRRIALAGLMVRLGFVQAFDWLTIVGVVGDTQDGGLDAKPIGALYQPITQDNATGGTIVIQAERNVEAQAPAATAIIRRVAPGALIERVLSVAEIKEESVAPRRLNAALISSLSILAVLIAAVGIGGVLVFSVSARTREIGIRMGLGADRGKVQWMILQEGGTLVALGLTLGVVGAFFATRAMQQLLFGIEPHDPLTFIGVAAVMAAIGVVACWIPAIRASRIDPAITMRS